MKLGWEDLNMYLYGLLSALATAIIVLVRKVLTNERAIEMLKKEIEIREGHNRCEFDTISNNLTEIRSDIKQLIGRK